MLVGRRLWVVACVHVSAPGLPLAPPSRQAVANVLIISNIDHPKRPWTYLGPVIHVPGPPVRTSRRTVKDRAVFSCTCSPERAPPPAPSPSLTRSLRVCRGS